MVDLGRSEAPGALRDLLAVALRDPSLRVGFYVSAGDGYIDAAGRRLDLDALNGTHVITRITSDDEPLAVFVSDARQAHDPELLDAVLGAARAALENERLHGELRAQLREVRASRERLVTAGDVERQRIERNLHDGAQQRLVSLTMAVRLLRVQLGDDIPPAAVEALENLQRELDCAVDELRELARGIHPAILTDEGLVPALRSLPERCVLPVQLSGNLDFRPAPAIEAAAYFVASEALTNAVRHSHASAVTIDVAIDRGELQVVVADDGIGGANPHGAGLRGLGDRVAALGGDLVIQSPPEGGTRVCASLPTETGAVA